MPGPLPCPDPACPRAYRSHKALAKRHGAPPPARPNRTACQFVAAALGGDGLVCPGCLCEFATRSSLTRHLSGRRRPAGSSAAVPRVTFRAGWPYRFSVRASARPQRARVLRPSMHPTGEVSLPTRIVALRTARRDPPGGVLQRSVTVERGGVELTLSADPPAVALWGDGLLLVRTRKGQGGAGRRPTVFTLRCGQAAAVATPPVNVLEAAA